MRRRIGRSGGDAGFAETSPMDEEYEDYLDTFAQIEELKEKVEILTFSVFAQQSRSE